MELDVIPVMNGMLPRPEGGGVKGIFIDPTTVGLLSRAGTGGLMFLAPFVPDTMQLYPVGVIGRIEKMWSRRVFRRGSGGPLPAIMVAVRGMGRGKARCFTPRGEFRLGAEVEPLRAAELRAAGYPFVCGAGWRALGGSTEVRASDDIRITIYGGGYHDGRQVSITASLGALVEPFLAHSVEHAIVRSLQQYALCTPKTLVESLGRETAELKGSVEVGFRLQMPEVFGVTRAGSCGNPLTNLAHFYLAHEVAQGLSEGKSLAWSVQDARKRTLSRIASDLEVTTEAGLRAIQGLKKGMLHDDTPISFRRAARILERFPADPWS